MLKEKTVNQDITQIVNKVVSDAQKAHIVAMITIGTTLATSTALITNFLQMPSVFGTIGIHPCDAPEEWQQNISDLEKLFSQEKKIVGIGECGLDFYHPGFIAERQKSVFRAHIELALTRKLPLVIHTRNSFNAALSIIDEYRGQYSTDAPAGVFHCFSEDAAAARQIIDRGFLVGIGGAVTYPKNESLRTVVQSVGLEHIVLETDAPFLPPQGFRGTINTPSHIATIAHFLANFLGYSLDDIANTTTHNATRLFKIDLSTTC